MLHATLHLSMLTALSLYKWGLPGTDCHSKRRVLSTLGNCNTLPRSWTPGVFTKERPFPTEAAACTRGVGW